MRDKRRVEDLSIEELEHVLALRKREGRQQRLERMKRNGRVIETAEPISQPQPSAPQKRQQSLDDVMATISANPQQVRHVDNDRYEVQKPARTTKGNKASKRATNVLLLLVEVAAVVGLVFLGWQLLEGIIILEETSAEAQAAIEEANARTIPTIEPTPMLALNQVVLPGGHKWVEGQTPTLNEEEIPENVRFMVADQITRPIISRPPATDDTALRLTIPSLNVDQTIVQGSDWEALKQGVGQVVNGFDPGDDIGNVALTAHNDIYGELFRHLDQLQPGDQFQIQTAQEVHLYQITGTDIVDPTAVHVLNSQGKATATLISCYPYRVNTKRIVISADRIG